MSLGVLGDPFIGRFATRPWDRLEIEHCISAAQEAASRGALESLLRCNSLTAFEEAGFPVGGVLVGESLEPWISVRMRFEERAECEALGAPFTLGLLQPIEHYETRHRRFRDAAAVDELMARSDPVAVATYDALVDEFNARLGEICESGLVEEAMEYVRRAKEIVC